MRRARPPSDTPAENAPWSPLALTVISLVFGLGAIVMSVRNLERMGFLDPKLARFYVWATVVFLASVLLLIWSVNPTAFEHSPGQQVWPLSVAAPLSVLLIQVTPFRRWRVQHPEAGTRPWFTALLPVVAMTIVTAAMGVIAIQIFAAIFGQA